MTTGKFCDSVMFIWGVVDLFSWRHSLERYPTQALSGQWFAGLQDKRHQLGIAGLHARDGRGLQNDAFIIPRGVDSPLDPFPL